MAKESASDTCGAFSNLLSLRVRFALGDASYGINISTIILLFTRALLTHSGLVGQRDLTPLLVAYQLFLLHAPRQCNFALSPWLCHPSGIQFISICTLSQLRILPALATQTSTHTNILTHARVGLGLPLSSYVREALNKCS